MHNDAFQLNEIPIYSPSEAARYLRVPYQTLRYWVQSNPVIKPASVNPLRLSFANLLECHMLSFLRSNYQIRIPKVRKALQTLASIHPSEHPLVDNPLETDAVDLFIREYGDVIINLCHYGQTVLKDVIGIHLRRIEIDDAGVYRFFPFVEQKTEREPKSILISPSISFGKPVIAGTGISTAVVASRFHARESIEALANEYGRPVQDIEEAIRWESKSIAA